MRLTDYFIDLVAYVVYFMKGLRLKQPSFDKVKTDINRLISESLALLDGGSFSREDYDMARFAIFAWIDEAILSSPWHERARWQSETLQREHYRTTDAGEQFFERLNSVGPHQRDVREVYYLCLAMGFTGRYCHEGDDYLLEQLKTSNLKVLTGSSAGVPSIESGELFPDAYPVESDEIGVQQHEKRFSTFTMFCIGFPILVFALLFLIFNFVLNSYGENILRQVT
ncbi:MAG: DotU family type IV/VI secretion system protein [Desulfobacterales bacterium]|nr:DotU family type IV/VI secretion system protein [Desulfobacterales bacterium]